MSHISQIKTRMVEKEFLLQALQDLGYEVQEGNQSVGGFLFQRTSVEIKVGTPGNAVGFRKAGDAYALVGDWWEVEGISRQRFLREVTQRYAYLAARDSLQRQGFSLISEERQKDGNVCMESTYCTRQSRPPNPVSRLAPDVSSA